MNTPRPPHRAGETTASARHDAAMPTPHAAHADHAAAHLAAASAPTPSAPHTHAPHAPHADHGHEHEHGHSHKDREGDAHHGHDHGVLPSWPRIAAALTAAVAAEACHWLAQSNGQTWPEVLGMALAVLAVGLAGLSVFQSGVKSLLKGKLGIHALMAVAVIGAFLIGQWPEAAMVMALYVAAERLEDQAMDRARLAIRQLLTLTPETADVLQANGQVQRMAVNDVPLHSRLRIAAGSRIPLDGEVSQGHSAVDQAPITGESTPVDKTVGDPLYAGSINQQGELVMTATATASNSLLARMVQLVEQAQATRAPTQRFVDRFAEVYTPIVFVLAVLLAVLAPLVAGWSWFDAVYQALALLVIACPCALVISTPVTVVSALTVSAQRGVLIKGGSALEQARTLRCIALDKTGTLTTGQPTLVQWQASPSANDQANAADTLHTATLAHQLASRSDHPVSRAMARGLLAELPQLAQAADQGIDALQALPGLGVQATWHGQRLLLGNLRLMREHGLTNPSLHEALQVQEAQGRSVTLLALGEQLLGWFAVADPLRDTTPAAIEQMKAQGLTPVVLSGDNPATVRHMATQAGIAEAHGGLLPQDKLALLQTLRQQHGAVAMTGDGINDAPALATADVAIAMGGAHGTAMAMETAQIVLMNDDLRRIPETVQLSHDAHRVLWQNIALALGTKLVFFGFALAGQASMWMAVAADTGVSLLVVANGMRLRRWQPKA